MKSNGFLKIESLSGWVGLGWTTASLKFGKLTRKKQQTAESSNNSNTEANTWVYAFRRHYNCFTNFCFSFVEGFDNWPEMEWNDEIFGCLFKWRMDSGIISLIRGRMGRRRPREGVIDPPIFLLPLQIWSMDSDEPVHSLKVDPDSRSLAWRPKAKTEDVDGGIDAARKSKENLTIAW